MDANLLEKVKLSSSTKMHFDDELKLLYTLASECGGNIANLGCFRGTTAATFALANDQNRVFTVDVYDSSQGESGANADVAMRLFEDVGVSDRVIQCVGLTHEWARRLAHVRFDLIFIDADHSNAGVMVDFARWSPLLNPHGIIAFHDANLSSVRRAIHQTVEKDARFGFEAEVQRLSVWRRNG
jgi:predicted O-methyltransferase YrrM